jgi:Tlde1 domain
LEIPDDAQVQLASLELPDKSDEPLGPDGESESRTASDRASFGERFSFDQAQPQDASLQDSASFEDRFSGTISLTPIRSALAEPHAAGPLAAPPQAPVAVVQAARKRMTAPKVQMASLSDDPLPAAYAPSDAVPKDKGIRDLLLRDLGPKDGGPKDTTSKDPLSDVDTSRTAIYDIAAHTVYLPNGQRLEAHSGLGSRMDNPRYVNVKMHGPTPPNVYELKLREQAFHGVRALRLNPVDETKMYGRDGILAHTYMLGSNGQSNGCVSFSDYQAFLNAYLRGEIERLVVVESLAAPPASKTASGWLSNTLKGIFGRS